MKVAILAGGLGSRMDPRRDSESAGLPKALAPLGGRPILWHILAGYAAFGLTDFTIALGHRGDRIRAWFREQGRSLGPAEELGGLLLERFAFEGPEGLSWSVALAETGEKTGNGGRIGRLAPLLGKESFMLTWCDGLSDLDLGALQSFHRGHGRLATVTAVHPPSHFGFLSLEGDRVAAFEEKPDASKSWINGAFFVLEPGIFDLIEGDESSWERGPMVELARRGELMAFRHEGFWQCMDSEMQRLYLDDLWARGRAPWKRWSQSS